jgi:hypothetical protein
MSGAGAGPARAMARPGPGPARSIPKEITSRKTQKLSVDEAHQLKPILSDVATFLLLACSVRQPHRNNLLDRNNIKIPEAQGLTEIKNVPLPRSGGSEDSAARTALQNSSMAAHARTHSARRHFPQVQKAGFLSVWLSQVYYFLFPSTRPVDDNKMAAPSPNSNDFW